MAPGFWRFTLIGLLAAAAACPAAAQAPDEKARRQFVTVAMLTCLTLESIKDASLRCGLEQSETGPILLVRFADGSKLQQHAPLVLSMLGGQVCDGTRASRAGASLALVDTQLNRATVCSCERRGFTGWIQLTGN